MQSKNKKAPTVSERAHIERVKAMDCAVCCAVGPSDAHEIKQGDWWTAIPLCVYCHRPPDGIHGNKTMWRIMKMDELSALSVTVRRLVAA